MSWWWFWPWYDQSVPTAPLVSNSTLTVGSPPPPNEGVTLPREIVADVFRWMIRHPTMARDAERETLTCSIPRHVLKDLRGSDRTQAWAKTIAEAIRGGLVRVTPPPPVDNPQLSPEELAALYRAVPRGYLALSDVVGRVWGAVRDRPASLYYRIVTGGKGGCVDQARMADNVGTYLLQHCAVKGVPVPERKRRLFPKQLSSDYCVVNGGRTAVLPSTPNDERWEALVFRKRDIEALLQRVKMDTHP